MNTEILLKDGYTPFGRTILNEDDDSKDNQELVGRLSDIELTIANDNIINNRSEPAFYVMANAGWHDPKSVGFSGWKIGETIRGVNRQVQVVFETSWYHSIQLEEPREFVGGPFRAAVADYVMGMACLFQQGKFCPTLHMDITYEKSIRVGEVLETIQTDIGKKEDGKFTQEGIQRIYGSDKTIGTVKTLHLYPQSKGKNT